MARSLIPHTHVFPYGALLLPGRTEPVLDHTGQIGEEGRRQRVDRMTGLAMWQIQVLNVASARDCACVVPVTILCDDQPEVPAATEVVLNGLAAQRRGDNTQYLAMGVTTRAKTAGDTKPLPAWRIIHDHPGWP